MPKKLAHLALLFALSVGIVACGGDQVTVRVLDEGPEGELQPQSDVVVEFLPYDRDSIFEALEARADTPQPPIPDTLRALYAEIIDLQNRWREAEARWQTLRDSLKSLSDAMRGMDETTQAYRNLYSAFTDLEPRVTEWDNRKTNLFEQFDSLQNQTIAFSDSIQALRQSWGDEAYRGYGAIVDSILEATGEEARVDTTGDEGYATVALPGGTWWAYARVNRPFEELYWNVSLVPGQVDTLELTPENAEVRLRL